MELHFEKAVFCLEWNYSLTEPDSFYLEPIADSKVYYTASCSDFLKDLNFLFGNIRYSDAYAAYLDTCYSDSYSDDSDNE